MQDYLKSRMVRLGPFLILAAHLLWRSLAKEPTWFSELILFNLVALLAMFAILLAPDFNDPLAKAGGYLAIGLWFVGSITSTWNSYFTFQFWSGISDFGYALFYPCAIFGLSRALHFQNKSAPLELLDTIIVALGSTTILATFLLKPATLRFSGSAVEIFLSILYPIGDLVLLSVVLVFAVKQKISARALLLISGVSIFTATDLYFLWQSSQSLYIFGSLSDDGWLLGIALIAQSFWHKQDQSQPLSTVRKFSPLAATFALLASATILTISALRPGYFPGFTLIPAFATIALAFIRMTVAINDAKAMSSERILARTDELTGLANRRKFISELEIFRMGEGSLLLLDLDHFKEVNDRFGHGVGDQLLKQVAMRFTRAIPASSLLARLGGDEFGALIAGNEGLECALALRATLSYPFDIAGESILLDVSIGHAQNQNPGGADSELLLRRADLAMYEAKRAGQGVLTWSASL